jgi:membrane-bound lytic murein transglycosylase F
MVLALNGCGKAPSQSDLLAKIRTRGEVVVATLYGPTTYYESRDGESGPEFDAARHFAEFLGVKLRVVVQDNIADVLKLVRDGQADFAAAGLSRTLTRADHFLFGPVYQTVQQQVVCRRGGKQPSSLDELSDVQLRVPAGSSYAERLRELAADNPTLQWEVDSELGSEQLLEQVWNRQLDCTIADSNIVDVNRRYYAELSVRFDIGEAESLSWVLPAGAQSLREAMDAWFTEFAASGELRQMLERYYGFIDVFDYVDTRVFTRRIKQVLPKYQSYFETAAAKHDLDWTLLAAQSYQESHWKPRARSPTGVRGIMMLTLPTARELGVKSRLNAAQSIEGAARYLAQLRDRLPEEVTEPHRTWLALAAYNVGYGHLQDAMTLAREQGKNPYLWSDLATVLPLLSQKRYYRNLKHGYARGNEPVRYVTRVRDFHDILVNTLYGGRQGEARRSGGVAAAL